MVRAQPALPSRERTWVDVWVAGKVLARLLPCHTLDTFLADSLSAIYPSRRRRTPRRTGARSRASEAVRTLPEMPTRVVVIE